MCKLEMLLGTDTNGAWWTAKAILFSLEYVPEGGGGGARGWGKEGVDGAEGIEEDACRRTHRKKFTRKDYAFQRQLNDKPSIIPGCPGRRTHIVKGQRGTKEAQVIKATTDINQ